MMVRDSQYVNMSILRMRERDGGYRIKRTGQSARYHRDGVALNLIASSMSTTPSQTRRGSGQKNRKKIQARRTRHTPAISSLRGTLFHGRRVD
ncbi:hypothetical protein P5V15_004853 [Pogonomyrmex californicus]